jgi:uncharacterized protein (TIGR03083 family)
VSETSTAQLLALLHADHDRLAAAITGLTDDQTTTQSYDDDWSVAQVASHLGSGAEVFQLFLDAGRTGEPSPEVELMQPIWDAWNVKQPADQAHDAVVADAALLARIDALTDDERERWELDMFGEVRDLEGFLRMRLAEHAVHTWDIVVSFDPSATVPEDAIGVVVDQVGLVAGYTGQKHDEQVSVEVRTTNPERAFHLDLGPSGVQLSPSSDDTASDAELTLPAEAFVRLVYGRLDPDHTPDGVQVRGVDLDLLRTTFPGV